MNAKVFKWPVALVIFVVAISVGAGVSKAQYDAPPMMPPMDAPPAEKPKPTGPVINKAEEEAYKGFLAARSGGPAAQITSGEAFAAKFPQSRYLSGIYGTLTTAYFAVGQEDKMFTAGTKAIELNPDNVDVLSLLAMSIPRRVKSTTPPAEAAQQMQKAEAYGRHVIELMPNLAKPPDVDQATFEKAKNDKLSLAHSGLGLIAINRQKYEDARTELTQAVQLASNPDPVDYFLLGNADSQASYYNDAIAAYEKCSTSGPLTAQCKGRAETAKHDAATKMGR